ncbi:MAG: M56 family metallopeptidase [Bacteroidales bacterium]
MESIVIYLLKVSVALLIFYPFYLLVMRKSTFYQFNRFYLLSSLIISLIIPFFPVPVSDGLTTTGAGNLLEGVTVMATKTAVITISKHPDLLAVSALLYIIFLSVPLCLLLVNLSRILILRRHSKTVIIDNILVYIVDTPVSSFSFGKWIFLDKRTFHSKERMLVIEHERAHVSQFHTFDLFLTEIYCSLLWFHPMVYLYRRSIREVHEYLADNAVLNKGYEAGHYLRLLYNQVITIRPIPVSNYFNQSLLKRRFIMITKSKSGRISAIIAAFSIPIITCMCFISVNLLNFPLNAQEKQIKFVPPKMSEKKESPQKNKSKEKEFVKIDKQAEYPGGFEALQQYIAKEITYPASAKKWGIQSKIYIRFLISESGIMTDFEVLKIEGSYADPKGKKPTDDIYKTALNEMETEALRVIRSAPGVWKPAESDGGKAVKVNYTIPISFKLK